MASQLIESQDLTVGKLFHDYYSVPDYQREYVWQEAEVEQLLTDIHAEFEDAPGSQESEYFIGSVVVCPGTHQVFDLIDGQQRVTTLYAFFCAVRDHLKQIGASPLHTLDQHVASVSIDASGQEQSRYRVTLRGTSRA